MPLPISNMQFSSIQLVIFKYNKNIFQICIFCKKKLNYLKYTENYLC